MLCVVTRFEDTGRWRRDGNRCKRCKFVRRTKGEVCCTFSTEVTKGVLFMAFFFDRVALARAVYARSQFVLLDDPLSAVVRLFLVLIPNLST